MVVNTQNRSAEAVVCSSIEQMMACTQGVKHRQIFVGSAAAEAVQTARMAGFPCNSAAVSAGINAGTQIAPAAAVALPATKAQKPKQARKAERQAVKAAAKAKKKRAALSTPPLTSTRHMASNWLSYVDEVDRADREDDFGDHSWGGGGFGPMGETNDFDFYDNIMSFGSVKEYFDNV